MKQQGSVGKFVLGGIAALAAAALTAGLIYGCDRPQAEHPQPAKPLVAPAALLKLADDCHTPDSGDLGNPCRTKSTFRGTWQVSQDDRGHESHCCF